MKVLLLRLPLAALVTSFCLILEAKAQEDSTSDNTAECRFEYDKSSGPKSKSQKSEDAESCRGVVGESFCLSDKEAAYLKQCKSSKSKTPTKPANIEIPLEEELTEPAEEKPADGFKEL